MTLHSRTMSLEKQEEKKVYFSGSCLLWRNLYLPSQCEKDVLQDVSPSLSWALVSTSPLAKNQQQDIR